MSLVVAIVGSSSLEMG